MIVNNSFSKVKTACKLNIIIQMFILHIHVVITSQEARGKDKSMVELELFFLQTEIILIFPCY